MKMRRVLALVLTLVMLSTMAVFTANAADTDKAGTGAYYNQNKYSNQTYSGEDLGCTYTKAQTTWKVWSPAATKVQLKLYRTGTDRENGAGVIGTYNMTKGTSSVWSVTLSGDHKNEYYTYLVTAPNTNGTSETNETQDIYSKAVGANGLRSMVVDLDSTDPEGWDNDKHVTHTNKTEAAVWELHIRDFSADPDSGVSAENQGNYLAFTEGGTTYKKQGSIKTCIDYLVENNINTVQLMPFADFEGIDEINGDDAEHRNWGYNPRNYNVPDGAYSSDPYDGNVRINETKQMIQALHDRGIAVVMDVVYNHTAGYEASCFTKTVPGYYYRMSSSVAYINGSGQGNELATENAMCRNFVVQSLYYWASEYHIDGFRFDLMACIDIDTLNQARAKLNTIDRGILMYGEPWAAGDTGCTNAPYKSNFAKLTTGIGGFDEDSNDASIYTKQTSAAWVQGASAKAAATVTGIKANYMGSSDNTKTVNYTDNHDNYTLWDKLVGARTSSGEGKASVTVATNVNSTADNYTSQLKLAGTLFMTSQGIKFMNSGTEFARTKQGQKNSYNSFDSINMLDWKRAGTYANSVAYYKGLRQINEVYTPFHDDSATSKNTMSFISQTGTLIAYTINNNTANKANEWGKVAVCLNSGSSAASVNLSGNWTVVANKDSAGVKSLGTASGSYSVPARSGAILVETSSFKDFSSKFTYGTLTTNHYVNGAITKTTKALYRIGTKYHALKDADLLKNYNVTKTEGTASGTFSADTTVNYYYEPNGKTIGKLTVNYVDGSNKALTPSMVYSLEAGDKYSIPVCAVEGYQLNTDKYPAGTTGTFTGQDKTITFTYKPLDSQTTTVHYYRSNARMGSDIFCYAYTDDGEEPLGAWPKQDKTTKLGLMVRDSAKGANWYKITINKASCKVMFHGSGGQEPGQNEPGYAVAGECSIQNKVVTYDSTTVVSYIDIDTGAKLKADSKKTESKKSTDQYTTAGDNTLGTLVETPANAAGFYAPGTTNVVYLYRTKAEPTQAPTTAPVTQAPTTAPVTQPITTQPITTQPPTVPEPTTTAAPVVIESYILGDSNCDGTVNINDVTYIQQYLVNLVVFDSYSMRNANVDGDNRVSIKDANYIQRHLAGLATPYKIGQVVEQTAPTPAPVATTAPAPTTPVVTDPPVTDPVYTDPVTDPIYTDPIYTDPETDPIYTDPVSEYHEVLFTNNLGWSGVNVYYWFDGEDGEYPWPGLAMDEAGYNDYGEQQFKAEIPVGCNVIFCSADGSDQTCDIVYEDQDGFYIDTTAPKVPNPNGTETWQVVGWYYS